MVTFLLNGLETAYSGAPDVSLLSWIREDQHLTGAKDGCSGQAACGACLVEIDGRGALACATPMGKLKGKTVVTIEGFPEALRRTLGQAFAAKGGVQCGFCTPGFLTRTKILLETHPNPSREEVVKALRMHLCRCTGYVKIVDAVLEAARCLREGTAPELPHQAAMGASPVRFHSVEKAIGDYKFTGDLHFEGMAHGALHFSAHPRARVLSINTEPARKAPGVLRVFTAADIPGEHCSGMLIKDWPLMVAEGETTRSICDVLAGVVAETDAQARAAAGLIEVEYGVLEPLTDPAEAMRSEVHIHPGRETGNILSETVIRRGGTVEDVFKSSKHVVRDVFTTQTIEHGFLETECSVAVPEPGGVLRVYDQGQGIWHDRDDIARLLALPTEKVQVTMVDAGGAFGGKEDLTVQGHAALYAHLLERPVKVRLSRPESLRMHPKRHPMRMEYTLACGEAGMLTGLKARILGDTGAYASIGSAVMARAATHAAAAYHVPHVDVLSRAIFTNNIPNGAMRGFGVNQVAFAMESMVERLCREAGFDPWQFRFDNALATGRMVTTGQVLGEGVGLRACLQAIKPAYDAIPAAQRGLAMAIKNCGIGNGVPEINEVRLEVLQGGRLRLTHGWSEMGQGIHTVAAQYLGEALGAQDMGRIEVRSNTDAGAIAGATTASRGTFQLGMAVLDAAKQLKASLDAAGDLEPLAGQVFTGRYECQGTAATGEPGTFRNHLSYSYAAHLVILDEAGAIQEIIAAHDAGRLVNPVMFEGQIEGGVAMGVGAALSETFPLKDGRLVSDRLAKLGLPKITDMPPRITVIAVDEEDPEGPLGAKGAGEIGSIPTVPAIANAFTAFDGQPRTSLPMLRPGQQPAPSVTTAPFLIPGMEEDPWSCF